MDRISLSSYYPPAMQKSQLFLFLSWIIASASMLGSLFFSEVMQFPPCVLCWYQRIAMYPLVIVLLVGAIQGAKPTFWYAIPLAGIGWFIALYHNLLHYKIVPESASPCIQGVPCSTVYINWLGFITIPMLSFFAFSLITILLILLKREFRNER